MTREGERRQVTVLFADIAGFTAMSEKMDPETVSTIMNACFTELEKVVTERGGTVDKYMGDSIMALFGAPQALEDAAKRAVNAAIEMRNCLAQFNREQNLSIPLGLHIGINSGLVIAGELGGRVKRDFTVVGDSVNLASRLEGASKVGQIFVGAETFAQTRDQFDYRALPPLRLKGLSDPVRAYELLSVKEKIYRPKPGSASRMIFSELIGRDQELAQLKAEIMEVVETERGAVVSLFGDAGVGKSRFLAEMAKLEVVENVTLLEGRSLAIGESLSFHPFIDLLRQWAGIAEDADEQKALTALELAVSRLFPDAAGEIFPFIATLMGMRLGGTHAKRVAGIEAEGMERLIFKSMRELFARMADDRPLVMVFDDVHWTDASSLKLLESLLDLVTHHRLLFINVFRPGYEATGERLLQYARDTHADEHLEVFLGTLSEKQSDLLVQNLLKTEELPFSIRRLIRSKAEGNPFYVEEVVRALIDEGAIEYKDGRFNVTHKVELVTIPETLQGVIMARFDRLEESSRRILQAAAVIGRSFQHRILAGVIESKENLASKLAYLIEKQLIFVRRKRRLTDRQRGLSAGIEYVFKHALAQETIYGSILRKTRKALHLRVAQLIESSFSDRLSDFYGMLAYHYSRAESLEKAEEYLFKAGDEAAKSAASAEALNYFREASRLYFLIHGEGGDRRRRALLAKNIGLALLNTGNLSDSIEHLNNALELHGERVPRATSAVWLAFVRDLVAVLSDLYMGRKGRVRNTSEVDREVAEVRFARCKAQVTNDPQRFFFDSVGTVRHLARTDPATIDGACGMYAGASALFSFSGFSFAVARRFIRIAGSLVREGNPRELFVFRSMQFVLPYLDGDWDEKQAIEESVVEDALRYGQVWDVNNYLGLNCERKIHRGEFSEALRLVDKLAEISRAYGYTFARSTEYSVRGFLFLEQRDLEKARSAIDLYYETRHEEALRVLALGTRGRIQILQEDLKGAADTLRKTEALMKQSGLLAPYHASAYFVSRLLMDLAVLEKDAAGCFSSGLTVSRRQVSRSAREALKMAAKVAAERTEVYRLAGRLQWLLGKKDRALSWWARSIEEGNRLGARPALARTHMEVGRRMLEGGGNEYRLNELDAASHLERAEQLFSDMKMEWDLTRLGDLRERAA